MSPSGRASRIEALAARGPALAAALGVLLGTRTGVQPLRAGLDPSFVYAYNAAPGRELVWGREFVSTYGPLGYLLNPLDVGHNAIAFAVFGVALGGLLGWLAWRFAASIPELGDGAKLALATAVLYAASMQAYEWPLFAALVLALVAGLGARHRLAGFAFAGALSGVFLLIKFSLGFGAVATTLLATASGMPRPRPAAAAARAATAAACAAASCGLGWTLTVGEPSALADYLVTGWEISSGYSSAMGLVPPLAWISAVCFLLFFAGIVFWVAGLGSRRAWAVLGVLAFPLFTGWKHAMVRQDGHVAFLTLFGLFVVVLFAGLSRAHPRRALAHGAISIVLLVAASTANGLVPPGELAARVASPARRLAGGELLRLARYGAYRERLAAISAANLRERQLGESMRAAIGAATVDVYPWETVYAPANGLAWHSRPNPASFSGYTPRLDGLNAQFLEGATPPALVLWHHDVGVRSIDARHLFFDEPLTLRALFSHYRFAAFEPGVTLLRRARTPRLGPGRILGELRAPWGTWVETPVERSGALTLEIRARRSPIAALKQLAFRQGPVALTLRFTDGTERMYRVPPENLVSGMWIEPFPASLSELVHVLGDGTGSVVNAVRADADAVTRGGGELALTWRQHDVLEPPEALALRPPPAPAVPSPGAGCAGPIERATLSVGALGAGPRYTTLSGWADAGEPSGAPLEIWITDGEGRLLPTAVDSGFSRPDVVRETGKPYLELSGFTAFAPHEPGGAGFVVRDAAGKLRPSCNRVALP